MQLHVSHILHVWDGRICVWNVFNLDELMINMVNINCEIDGWNADECLLMTAHETAVMQKKQADKQRKK